MNKLIGNIMLTTALIGGAIASASNTLLCIAVVGALGVMALGILFR